MLSRRQLSTTEKMAASFWPSFLTSQMQPVLSADCYGAHRVLGEVCTQLEFRIFEERRQHAPERQGVVGGLSGGALGQCGFLQGQCGSALLLQLVNFPCRRYELHFMIRRTVCMAVSAVLWYDREAQVRRSACTSNLYIVSKVQNSGTPNSMTGAAATIAGNCCVSMLWYSRLSPFVRPFIWYARLM